MPQETVGYVELEWTCVHCGTKNPRHGSDLYRVRRHRWAIARNSTCRRSRS